MSAFRRLDTILADVLSRHEFGGQSGAAEGNHSTPCPSAATRETLGGFRNKRAEAVAPAVDAVGGSPRGNWKADRGARGSCQYPRPANDALHAQETEAHRENITVHAPRPRRGVARSAVMFSLYVIEGGRVH